MNFSISFLKVFKRMIVTTQRPQSGSMNRILYWVNTRELDKELYTGLSTLYTKTPQSVLITSSLP